MNAISNTAVRADLTTFQRTLALDRVYVKGGLPKCGDRPPRILSWNIERGHAPKRLAETLVKIRPDFACLQEVDWGNERTDSRDVLAFLAKATGMLGLFAIEFLEVPSPYRPARFAGGGAVHGVLASLAEKQNFVVWLKRVAGSEWVVYAKPPFGGPRQVLQYLARYTHRVAISNQRLIALENGGVTFRWKNYARASEPATMTLQATEFIRRFLLHVLPRGFVKVRHFGFLANRGRRHSVRLCRKLLAARSTQPEGFDPRHDSLSMEQDAGPLDRCPRCKVGSMRPLEILHSALRDFTEGSPN